MIFLQYYVHSRMLRMAQAIGYPGNPVPLTMREAQSLKHGYSAFFILFSVLFPVFYVDSLGDDGYVDVFVWGVVDDEGHRFASFTSFFFLFCFALFCCGFW